VKSHISKELVEYLATTTYFGKFLFKLAPSDTAFGRIKSFINWYAREDGRALDSIRTFNTLAERAELATLAASIPDPICDDYTSILEEKDEEIDRQLELKGKCLSDVAGDLPIFSMCQDISVGVVESLVTIGTEAH
jgi:hypothetical protein